MNADRYCVRNDAGFYLTHSVDFRTGGSRLWFTPSPWMAHLLPTQGEAERIAKGMGGTAQRWERPVTV